MTIEKFEDIISWQKARVLTLRIYQIFKTNKDFSFKDQIQRACVSIMNNIAEGFGRRGDKEFIHFLFIAKGSCSEARSMLYLAHDLKYISEKDFQELTLSSLEISKLISGLIKALK